MWARFSFVIIAKWLSIRGLLIIEIATVGLLMQMDQLLIIERVLERFQRVGVDEVVLLWLLRVVTSLRMSVDVVGLGMLHRWTLRVILRAIQSENKLKCLRNDVSSNCVSLPVHYHNLGHLLSEVGSSASLCPSSASSLSWAMLLLVTFDF